MALTSLPAAGSKLRATVLESLITEVRDPIAYKTADETIASSTTLQNDDELFVTVAANAAYRLQHDFVFNSGTTPDIKFTYSLPSGGAGKVIGWAHNTSNVIFTFNGLATATYSLSGIAAVAFVRVSGYITTSSAGTVQVQWAQNTSDPGSTTVLAGSSLQLTRVS